MGYPDEFVALPTVDRRSSRAEAVVLAGTVEPTDSDHGAERLRRAEKAAAVGHLAGGLAHDFNNLLGVVVGNLDRVGRLLPIDTIASRCVADALSATDRAAALVQRLLAFVRQQPLLPELIEIDRLLLDLKPLIEVSAPACLVVLDLDCGGSSLVDANQLENAVLNLAVNARDAMPGGGRITIVTRTLSARIDEADAASAARDYVVLEFCDNGVGMSPEVQAKASEPFFTTKALGSGTGLGLSQVHGFARQCGGSMRLTSEMGRGTTVTLLIPRVDAFPVRPILPVDRLVGVEQIAAAI